LDNRFYALQVDPARGAVRSLVDKDTGEELVDREDRWGFAQCLYETLSGGREMKPDQFHRSSLRNIQVQPGAGGPVWQSLLISGDMDGCASNHGVRLEIRLYDTEKRVEFHFALRKLPVRHPEAVYVAFPFRGSANAIQYEGQGGLVTPGAGQLPGSSSDWQTVQSFLRVNRGDGQVIWGCAEAPLVQLGDFNLGKWQPVTRVDQPRVYSWVMNNYWFTNFRAEQEGEFKWVYYLTSTRQTNAVVAAQFGWSSRVPLASRVLPPAHGSSGDRPPTLSTLALDAPNLLLVEARPAREDRAVTLHLREADGQSARLTRTDVTSSAVLRGADEVNVLEDVREASIGSLSFTPWETRFVVLKFR
jgi:hypothetical protein